MRVVDVGYFGVGHLRSMRPAVEVIREDVRRFCEDPRECSRILNGMHCVIHLAAISNDPSAELDPALTAQVNFQATRALAEAAKARGIRFIFSSSCSVYGEAPEPVPQHCDVIGPDGGRRGQVGAGALARVVPADGARDVGLLGLPGHDYAAESPECAGELRTAIRGARGSGDPGRVGSGAAGGGARTGTRARARARA